MRSRILVLLLVIALLVPAGASLAQEEGNAIEIAFWHAMSGARIDFIDRMVADFNYTHPGIHVTAEYKGSYRDTLNGTLLAAEQGNAPHVVQIFEVGSQEALDTGIFAPAFELAGDNPEILREDDFIPAFASYYSFDGEFYSFPFNSSNAILYYNADMLEAAGVTMPDPWAGEDLSFEWMLDVACPAIVDGGVAESCITWPLHTWFFEQWLAEQGAPMVNNDNGRAARADDALLDSQAALNIFSWWNDMYQNGYYVYSGTYEDWAGSRTIFNSGQSAMLISSTSDVTQAQNWAVEGGFTLGTAALPIPAGTERNGAIVGGASLWLTADHPQEELDAALEFALWISNTENAVRWHKGTGYFPIRLSAVDVLEVENWFERNPAYREAFNQLLETKVNTATAGAVMGAFPEVRTIVEEAAESMFVQGVSPEDALATADSAADAAIADYNSTVQ
jgi:sn-glycerol 3-phosphate transport system substrate-binding protein